MEFCSEMLVTRLLVRIDVFKKNNKLRILFAYLIVLIEHFVKIITIKVLELCELGLSGKVIIDSC